jgi:chromosome segregation ATPase
MSRQLRTRCSRVGESTSESRRLRRRKIELQRRLSGARRRSRRGYSELRSASAGFIGKESPPLGLHTEFSRLHCRSSALQSQLIALQSQLIALQSQLSALQSQLSALQSQLSALQPTLTKIRTTLRGRLRTRVRESQLSNAFHPSKVNRQFVQRRS